MAFEIDQSSLRQLSRRPTTRQCRSERVRLIIAVAYGRLFSLFLLLRLFLSIHFFVSVRMVRATLSLFQSRVTPRLKNIPTSVNSRASCCRSTQRRSGSCGRSVTSVGRRNRSETVSVFVSSVIFRRRCNFLFRKRASVEFFSSSPSENCRC